VSRQLLIYDKVVAIGTASHANVSVQMTDSYSFARQINSVPLLVAEFEAAALDHPIVFARNGTDIFPAALLSLRPDCNESVDERGQWHGGYIPAFLRRYPFVFSRPEDSEEGTFALCLDESYAGVNREGRGERLFNDAGEQTAWLDAKLAFTAEYQAQFHITRSFCKLLDKLGLLEAAQARFHNFSGGEGSMGGFSVLNRSRLKQIPADDIGTLFRNGGLSLCYAHLHSLRNILRLGDAARAASGLAANAA